MDDTTNNTTGAPDTGDSTGLLSPGPSGSASPDPNAVASAQQAAAGSPPPSAQPPSSSTPPPPPAPPTAPPAKPIGVGGLLSKILTVGAGGAFAGAAAASRTHTAGQAIAEGGQAGFEFNQQVRAANERAAKSAVDQSVEQHRIQYLDAETKASHEANERSDIELLGKLGMRPVAVVDTGDQEAQKGVLQSLSDRNNGQGYPSYTTRVLGDKTYFFTPGGSDSLQYINWARSIQRMPQVTPDQWSSIPEEQRVAEFQRDEQLLTPSPNLQTLPADVGRLKSLYNTYKDRPDADPQALQMLKERYTNAQSMLDGQQAAQDRVLQQKTAGQVTLQNTKDQSAERIAELRKEATIKAAELRGASVTANKLVGKMMIGQGPDGRQVAGTSDELQAAGVQNPVILPANEVGKVVVARQLVAPDGLFNLVAKDMDNLSQKGKLGVAATRWSDFMTSKVGTEPDFAPLRAHMGLLATALMQAHVGARGGKDLLEHFKELADYRISDEPTLRSALSAEYKYAKEKAAIPGK